MPVTAPPPDFRYIGLSPGPLPLKARNLGLGAGSCAFGVGVAMAGAEPATLVAAALAGVLSSFLAIRALGPVVLGSGVLAAHLSIVPWGVVVHADPTPRVLRWAGVRAIDVRYVHEMDHATPSIRWSVVRVHTHSEVFAGRAHGAVSLERLEAYLHQYAEEASKPLALDLDGRVGVNDFLDPVFERLLAEARNALATGLLSERLGLEPPSYRQVRADSVSSVTESRLCEVLVRPTTPDADPRPFAALLAAEIGAKRALGAVLSLCSSPHPLVAIVARAAALRLGAEVRVTGALAELAEFVEPGELAQAEAYCALG